MTDKKKFDAIVKRIRAEGWLDDPNYISVIVIVGYLDKLEEAGLVTNVFNLSPAGKKIISICEEFDWKPSDAEIQVFVNEMVESSSKSEFVFILKQFRDNYNGLTEKLKKYKSKN